jgi:hypothetical protein
VHSIPRLLDVHSAPAAQIPLWDGKAGLRTAQAISSFLA